MTLLNQNSKLASFLLFWCLLLINKRMECPFFVPINNKGVGLNQIYSGWFNIQSSTMNIIIKHWYPFKRHLHKKTIGKQLEIIFLQLSLIWLMQDLINGTPLFSTSSTLLLLLLVALSWPMRVLLMIKLTIYHE